MIHSRDSSRCNPNGTIIIKDSDGTITYYDPDGNKLEPIDSKNPSIFAQVVMMKMSTALRIPEDLPVGKNIYRASEYLELSMKSNKPIHRGTKGHQMVSFTSSGEKGLK